VNAIIAPLALKGPCLTIRKFAKRKLNAEDLVNFNAISLEMAEFLEVCVAGRKNVIVSGGTGSGKTTLLNILSNFIPMGERVITVEDAAELKLNHAHLVSLESRPANVEGRGGVSIRELVKNTLRMRPDRIVVGECRGAEALDMLQAMNTGHEGSLTTLHANTPRDGLARLETMILMAGMDLPLTAIREQIASAVDIVVQQTRFACGSRKVTSITELTGSSQEKFKFKNFSNLFLWAISTKMVRPLRCAVISPVAIWCPPFMTSCVRVAAYWMSAFSNPARPTANAWMQRTPHDGSRPFTDGHHGGGGFVRCHVGVVCGGFGNRHHEKVPC
jgi:Flp pilus assembly CpaF family ATPase